MEELQVGKIAAGKKMGAITTEIDQKFPAGEKKEKKEGRK